MERTHKYSLPVLFVGIFPPLGGLAGSAPLYTAPQNYRHTTGPIRRLGKGKAYRHRKLRYRHTMQAGCCVAAGKEGGKTE